MIEPKRFWHKMIVFVIVLSVFAVGTVLAAAATSTAPAAGTIISNQAVAHYELDFETRSVTSNIVYVTVAQIAGVQVSPGNSETVTVQVAKDQTVHYTFTVTNLGNGPDSFELDLVALTDDGQLPPDSLELFLDVNDNGVIDAGDTQVSSAAVGPIASGDSVRVIARFKVPSGAEGDEKIEIQLTATSVYENNVSEDSAVVTFTVLEQGVLTATMSAVSNDSDDTSRVWPEGTITYTITVTNSGMTDVSGGKVIIDLPDHTALQGDVNLNGNPVQDPINFPDHEIELPDLIGGQSTIVVYTVKVNENAPVGLITNQATVEFGSNSNKTNEVSTRVRQVAAVALAQGAVDHNHSVNPTEIGKNYEFPYTVSNTGNGVDRIYVGASMDNDWTVAIFNADGTTPMPKDINGEYTVGNVPVGESVNFVVKVTVPTSAKSDSATHTLTVSATSEAGGTATPETSVLKNVEGAGVDLSVDKPEQSAKPGTPVDFIVTVENTGPASDLFDITSSIGDLPVGTTIEFFDEKGHPISDIQVPGKDSKEITVRVTIPAGTPPNGPEAFAVTVTSQNDSGVSKTIEPKLGVDTVVAVSLAPNRTGSAGRGSFTTYQLTLTNHGNDQVIVTLAPASTTYRMDYSIVGDAEINLARGASETITVRVDVPSTLATGTVETGRINANVGETVYDSATLTTTVTGGDMTLLKESDAKGDVKPGDTVKYTITARNISVSQLDNIYILESIPEHTEFVSATGGDGITIEYSADGGSDWKHDGENDPASVTNVKWILGDMASNADKVEVTITVRIKE